ncbi:MAG: NrsF family protein [Acetobacteraceae bacterium]
MSATDQLVDRLVKDAGPVRRLRPPVLRAAGWIGVAVVVAFVMIALHGKRPDLAQRMGEAPFVIAFLAAALTGMLAAVAAMTAALPDRSAAWLWLPAPAALVWLSTITGGCLLDWVRMGGAVPLSAVIDCLLILTATTVPLSAALFWLLRPLGRVMTRGAALVACLAVASFAAVTLNLVHAFNASALILASNFGAAALVWAIDAALARLALQRANRDAAAATLAGYAAS